MINCSPNFLLITPVVTEAASFKGKVRERSGDEEENLRKGCPRINVNGANREPTIRADLPEKTCVRDKEEEEPLGPGTATLPE